jgi:Tol biopolymer transport system component
MPRHAAALLVAVLATAALCATALAAASTPPKVARSDRNGEVAYLEGSTAVGLITPSGVPVGVIPKCSIPTCDDGGELAWSPGGRRLAFVRGFLPGGATHPPLRARVSLSVVNADGTHIRRLLRCGTCGLPQQSSISWSPDGSTIAVSDGQGSYGLWRLALVNVKTRSHRLVARCAVRSDAPLSPAWSPNGSKIAFGCGASLYLATRTGARAHVIATVPGRAQVGHLSWSPDGKTLAFDTPDSIDTVRADGSHLTTLLSGPAGSGPGFPSWSPDGTRIVYVNTPFVGGNLYEVWVMNADGTQNHRLYRSKGNVGIYAPPVWSPNGKQIAFSLVTNAESGLKVMNADGTDLHDIAPLAYDFAWQPQAANTSDQQLARRLVASARSMPGHYLGKTSEQESCFDAAGGQYDPPSRSGSA